MPRHLACRLLGCRWTFGVAGDEVVWRCARGCGAAGRRRASSEESAVRVVAHLNGHAPKPPEGMLAAMAGVVVPPGRSARDERLPATNSGSASRVWNRDERE